MVSAINIGKTDEKKNKQTVAPTLNNAAYFRLMNTDDVESNNTKLDNEEDVKNFWIDQLIKALRAFFVFLLFLTIFFAFIVYFENSHTDVNELGDAYYQPLFDDFINRYNKKYTNNDERAQRFENFKLNMKYMLEEQRKQPTVEFTITEFTDWSEDEMKLSLNQNQIKYPTDLTVFDDAIFDEWNAPNECDWRSKIEMTPVKNQAACGSCWAFATVAAVEALHTIKTKETVRLSEQQLVDCDYRNNGCHGGYRPYAMNYVRKFGLQLEESYPYIAKDDGECRYDRNKTRVTIGDYRLLSKNEDQIAKWISNNGPVTFGMKVVKSMYNYRSGIYSPSEEDCENHSLGSHALTIVGFGAEGGKNYWIVKNSWGTSWGDKGYFKLERGVNSCGAAENVVAAILE